MKLFLDKEDNKYKVRVNTGAKEVTLDTVFEKITPTVEKPEEMNDALLDLFKTRLEEFQFVWDHNGLTPDGEYMSIKDMYSTPDAPWMLPKIVSEQAVEAMEPNLMFTGLMHKIAYTMGQTLILPSAGQMSATNLDMSESDEYPEAKWQSGTYGTQMIQNMGKVGLAVKISEEMLRYSQFDVIGMHIKGAGKLLARHKEVKASNMVCGQGRCYFDNLNPTKSQLGVTTGRNADGSANGSLTAEDFMDLEGHMIAKGFVANTAIMHPLTYTMFRKDPIMRSFFMAGATTTYFGSYRGNPAGGSPWFKTASLMNTKQQPKIDNAKTPAKERNPDINTAPIFPGYWGVNFDIMVTPHMKYDVKNKLTDIIICDKSELGVLLVDEELTTEEWRDPARDITKIKFRERYSFGILNEGESVAVLRNVHNVPNKIIDEPARPHYNVNVTLDEIPRKNPIAIS